MKMILIIICLAIGHVAQGQMFLGSASVICSDCNRSKQGRGYESMVGMIFNRSWPGQNVTVVHYFLPFVGGQFTSPVFEFGEDEVPVRIFPNPTDDYLFISSDHLIEQGFSLEIIDMNGRQVFHDDGNHSGMLTRIDVSQIPSGFYSVTLRQGSRHASHIVQIIH